MTGFPQLKHHKARLHGLSTADAGRRLAYGTFLGGGSRYVFMETPKAACSTLKWILTDIEQRKVSIKSTGIESSVAMAIHLRASHGIPSLMTCTPAQFDTLLSDDGVVRFCVVRNPYARVLSAWADKIRQREPNYGNVWRQIARHQGLKDDECPTFRHFVQWITKEQDVTKCNHHWRGMTWLLLPDLMRYTHVLRTETLTEDLGGVLAVIAPGKDAKTLLDKYKLNESLPLRDWHAYYDEELAALVHRYYREDFERFGYDADSWKSKPTVGDERERAEIDSLLSYADALERRALEAIRARNDLIGKSLRQRDDVQLGPLRKFIAGGGQVADLLRDIGAGLLKDGQPTRAKDLLAAAHRLRPHGTGIRLLLARSLIEGGLVAEARPHLQFLVNDPVTRGEATALLRDIEKSA